MPIDPREFKRLVTNHFATVTDEEFLENLRKSSPYLFTEKSEATKDIQISDTSDLISNNCNSIIDRQTLEEFCPELIAAEIDDSELTKIENTEIYQQAKQQNKLEIAPKLLKKGMSIQEVAEILELDVHLIAK